MSGKKIIQGLKQVASHTRVLDVATLHTISKRLREVSVKPEVINGVKYFDSRKLVNPPRPQK